MNALSVHDRELDIGAGEGLAVVELDAGLQRR
jgi:hypothetical protein